MEGCLIMGVTSNLGITYPASTDYVKDGATAMQTIADGIDTKIANSGYANQLAYVYSSVARPVPFAMSTKAVALAGSGVASGASVTQSLLFTASTRFTQPPVAHITVSAALTGSAFVVPRVTATATTGFTYAYYNVATTAQTWASLSADVTCIQMTNGNAYNN
jgi:hypothetical protein